MSHKLIIFITPKDSNGFLMLDSGVNIIGSYTTSQDRNDALLFSIPDEVSNGNGARLRLERRDYIPLEVRGILWLNVDGTAILEVDDYHLQLKEVTPPPPPPPPFPMEPETIIKAIHSTGNYDLSTKEGCGKYTEACVIALHMGHSSVWGHIRKFGAQNQWNGHAVDAIMLLNGVGDTKAGIYDIIFNSESSGAKPSFQFKGGPNPDLWYYPA